MYTDLWIERFKREALPKIVQNFKPEMIILFGSRIKGEADESADIDAIIVSNEFLNVPFVNRMSLVMKIVRFEKHIDFICYSSEEFQMIKNKSSVLIDALENGEYVDF